jgi:hypothetical protein
MKRYITNTKESEEEKCENVEKEECNTIIDEVNLVLLSLKVYVSAIIQYK